MIPTITYDTLIEIGKLAGGTALVVYLALSQRVERGESAPAISDLAQSLKLGRSTVKRAIDKLSRAGLINVEDIGPTSPHVYQIPTASVSAVGAEVPDRAVLRTPPPVDNTRPKGSPAGLPFGDGQSGPRAEVSPPTIIQAESAPPAMIQHPPLMEACPPPSAEEPCSHPSPGSPVSPPVPPSSLYVDSRGAGNAGSAGVPIPPTTNQSTSKSTPTAQPVCPSQIAGDLIRSELWRRLIKNGVYEEDAEEFACIYPIERVRDALLRAHQYGRKVEREGRPLRNPAGLLARMIRTGDIRTPRPANPAPEPAETHAQMLARIAAEACAKPVRVLTPMGYGAWE